MGGQRRGGNNMEERDNKTTVENQEKRKVEGQDKPTEINGEKV